MARTMPAALVPIGHLEAVGPCRYVEHRPPGGGPCAVARIWRSEVDDTGLLRVVPDGCVELVRGMDGTVEVWGPAVQPRQVLLERDTAYDGVRVRAGAAAAVLGLPVDAIADQVLSAAEIASLDHLRGRDREQWLTRVLALAADGTAAWQEDAVAFLAPALLARPGARVAAAAETIGIGERQLHRRFRRAVGLSPAAYRRLARTWNALRDLSARADDSADPATTIAAIAHRRGFTDQSHLTREVVALTGLTPARLR